MLFILKRECIGACVHTEKRALQNPWQINNPWVEECHVGMAMQGSKLFLNLGHAMTNDERWEGETGDLALPHFCPERWLSEAGTRTGAWMPFGGGPRMCLGYLLATAEIKVPFLFAVTDPS